MAQPPNTHEGIDAINTCTGVIKANAPSIIAAVVITFTEQTLLNPVVAIDSPYEVLGNPHYTVPRRLAAPSPRSVRSSPGVSRRLVPMILDNTLWSEICSKIAQIATGRNKRITCPAVPQLN